MSTKRVEIHNTFTVIVIIFKKTFFLLYFTLHYLQTATWLTRFRCMILNNRTCPVHHSCIVITTVFNGSNGYLQLRYHDLNLSC